MALSTIVIDTRLGLYRLFSHVFKGKFVRALFDEFIGGHHVFILCRQTLYHAHIDG